MCEKSNILTVMDVTLFFLIFIIIIFFILLFFLWRWQQRTVANLVDLVFARSIKLISDQHQEVMQAEKDRIQKDLAKQQANVTSMLERLENSLKERDESILNSEKERVASFSQLSTQLKTQQESLSELKISTSKLSELLSHNQVRGQWGESIILDLLKANGLVKGVHFVTQQNIENTSLRPDVTLLLPEKTTIAVDVKFPLAQLAHLQHANDQDKKQLQKNFAQAVSLHVKKVAEYIQPAHGTLDFAVLFIPSEMVFSYIHQELPEVIALAMKERVLLVSPSTLLVVALMIRESFKNFVLSDNLREALQALELFLEEWKKQQDLFQSHGRALDTLQRSYEELAGVRTRQLEKRINLIRKATKGILNE